MTTLTLIGTVHKDHSGIERLQTSLELARPDLLAREKQDNFDQIRDQVPFWYSRFVKDELGDDISPEELTELRSYEEEVTTAYAAKHGTPLRNTDLSFYHDEPSFRKFMRDRYTFTKIENENTQQQQPARNPDKSYELGRACALGMVPQVKIGEYLDKFAEQYEIGPRDEHMAKYLRGFVESGKYKRVVQVVGVAHILDDSKGDTLFSMVKDLKPVVRFIDRPQMWIDPMNRQFGVGSSA